MAAVIGACGGTGQDGGDVEAADNAVVSAMVTVSRAADRSCSTRSVRGLAVQLVEEINCRHPETIAPLEGIAGLTMTPETFPFAQRPVAEALAKAAAIPKLSIQLTSALRTLPQQYLLSRWAAGRRCDIPMAARPGSSNHEEGLAVDVENHGSVRGALTKLGACSTAPGAKGACFRWLGAKDAVHFDYQGTGAVDIKGESVLAFQRLWNRNHPDDEIPLTGKFDAKTELRLKKSPAAGFTIGAECHPPAAPPAPLPPAPPPPVEDAPTAPGDGDSDGDLP